IRTRTAGECWCRMVRAHACARARPSSRSSPDRCASFTSLWPDRPSGTYSLDAMSMRIGATMRPTVVFDFDGTVALGRGPLEAYATCLGELTDGEMLTACRTAVERFDAGETNYRDGYDAIQTTARGRGRWSGWRRSRPDSSSHRRRNVRRRCGRQSASHHL